MLRYHMAVVTGDPELRRAVRRLTSATGATAQFAQNGAAIGHSDRPIDLAVFDAREADPSDKFLLSVPATAKIILIVAGDNLANRLYLMADPRVSSLFFHDGRFDDNEFICAATKALREEIFGLQKYLPWGVTTFTMTVRNYAQKRRAINMLGRFAKLAGIRGSVRDRILYVVDELIVNAMYHGPVDKAGFPKYRNIEPRDMAQLDDLEPVQIQYGCSGQYFGVAVRDGGGSLTRERTLEHLGRAVGIDGVEDKEEGLGLGLVRILMSCSKVVFNLEPGYSTEVISIFDMELVAQGTMGARSLHIHEAQPAPREDAQIARAAAITRSQPISPMWMLAAVLSVIVVGLGVAFLTRGPSSNEAAAERSVTVVPFPEDAEIAIDSRAVQGRTPVSLQAERNSYEVVVTREGFQSWSQTLSADELTEPLRIYVNLAPSAAAP